MAYPTVYFDSVNGTALPANVSGAGPDTAITGTKARNVGTSCVGLFESSPPDLSGIDTTGLHAVHISTISGRQWFGIIANKDSQQSVVGDITTGTTDVTNTDTTNFAVGNVVSIVGAGPAGATLYSYVYSIESSTRFHTYDAASTTVTGAAIVNPKSVYTTPNCAALTVDTVWAIGGKLRYMSDATQFWADISPGWTAYVSGSQIIEIAINLDISGTSSGKITITGDPNNKPVIYGDPETIICFAVDGSFIEFSNLAFGNTGSAIRLQTSASSINIIDCDFNSPYAACKSVEFYTDYTGNRVNIFGCKFNAEGYGVHIRAAVNNVYINNCIFLDGYGICTSANVGLHVKNCLFYGNSINYGIYLDGSVAGNCAIIENCTFTYGGYGIFVNHISRAYGLTIINCIFSHNTMTAIYTVVYTDSYKSIIDYNNFYSNSVDRSGVSAGAYDTAVDDQFFDYILNDYRVGTNIRAIGYPRSIPYLNTVNAVDIGCLQRVEPVNANILTRIKSVIEYDSHIDVYYLPPDTTELSLIVICKNSIPTEFSTDVLRSSIMGFLRDGSSTDLLGKEVMG